MTFSTTSSTWKPPYTSIKGASATITVLDEVASGTTILDLLNRKTEQVKQEMVMDLKRSLFGGSKERNPLRQAIADAYDEVMNIKQEEIEVQETNAAWDAVNKRKQEKAESRVQLVGDFLDDTTWDNGDTIDWTVAFNTNPDKVYHYTAIRGGPHWYITGDNTKYTNDGLTARLVGWSFDGQVIISGWDDPL